MATVKSKAKRKERKHVESGAAHIRSTFNNTIVTITDSNGNTIAWASAGGLGFKGSRKSTPFAAQMAAEQAAKVAIDQGMRSADVSSKDQAQAVKLLFVHCRQQASKSAALRTSPQFRTMAAVLRNAEEYKDYPFAYHFGAERRRRRTFG